MKKRILTSTMKSQFSMIPTFGIIRWVEITNSESDLCGGFGT